jgi:hypothetical protein
MLIGLCGYIGSGKDTCGSILEQHHGFQRLAFAAAIKDIVSILFGWDRDDLDGTTHSSREWREKVDVWWTEQLGRIVTPRIILQTVGTEMFRDCLSPRFWTTVLKRKIEQIQQVQYNISTEYKRNQGSRIVITDCRFPEEIELIKSLGGIIVYVDRSSDINSRQLEFSHSSEHHLGPIIPDATIDNNKDLEYLRIQLNTLIQFCEHT